MRKVLLYGFLSLHIGCNPNMDDVVIPKASFIVNESTIKTTDTITCDASGSISASDRVNEYFRWDWNNDGVWDTRFQDEPVIRRRFLVPGEYKIVLEVRNSNKKTDTCSHKVIIEQGFSPPFADFSINPPSGNFLTTFCFDARESFDSEDSLDQLLFRWDINGDGSWDQPFSNNSILFHMFKSMGTYPVSLEIKDPSGLSSTATKNLIVDNQSNQIKPSFSWSPEHGTTNDTIVFDASSTTYQNNPNATLFYSWMFDSNYEWTDWNTKPTLEKSFPYEMEYQIGLRIRDSNFLIASLFKAITIYHENLPPKADFHVGTLRGNLTTQFYFNAWNTYDLESLPTTLQVRWDFDGDGKYDTPFSYERIANFQYEHAGEYKIVLEAIDPQGLSDTSSQIVYVSPYTNPTGLIKDSRDGETYGTVFIGNQWWMSDNLNFAPLDYNKDYVRKLCYQRYPRDPVQWCDKLGGLYTAYHATRNDFYGDVEGICPKGWHIPSKADWENLIAEIGGSNQANKLLVGGETDFNLQFCGYALEGVNEIEFKGLGEIAYLWSFKRLSGWPIAQGCWNLAVKKDDSNFYPGYSGNGLYYSVRCIKNEE